MDSDGPSFIVETRETLRLDNSLEELYRSRVPHSCAISRCHVCDVDSFRCIGATGRHRKQGRPFA